MKNPAKYKITTFWFSLRDFQLMRVFLSPKMRISRGPHVYTLLVGKKCMTYYLCKKNLVINLSQSSFIDIETKKSIRAIKHMWWSNLPAANWHNVLKYINKKCQMLKTKSLCPYPKWNIQSHKINQSIRKYAETCIVNNGEAFDCKHHQSSSFWVHFCKFFQKEVYVHPTQALI